MKKADDLSFIRTFLSGMKFRLQGGYDAKKYWSNRLTKYGFDLRGVGNKSLSNKENQIQYREAGEVFTSLCRNSHIKFQNAAVLDVGCGTGFYARLLNDLGCTDYIGIDITDVLFTDLKKRFPNYQFKTCDITKEKLTKKYNLIIMIDVTQHITTERKLNFALNNIRTHMKANSLLIVTSFLDRHIKNSFYEKSRNLNSYKKIFDTEIFSEPQKFRDKYIFYIHNQLKIDKEF
jgi:2-polyprenyl-3-methyl-5-hydroxy-6-metoxy-1,4-benzoquinol methylase